MVTSWVMASGARLSSTVTVKLVILVFPLTSLAVNSKVLVPKSVQSNSVWLMARLSRLQFSVVPLSTSSAVRVAIPIESSSSVTFCATAVGANRSTTVTVAVAVETFPLTSVTVKVTGLAPKSAQLKSVWLRLMLPMAQAPPEPLSTAAAVVLALPEASRSRVMSWALASGTSLSSTVNVKLAVAVFPLRSVAVNTSVWSPTSSQSKAVWLTAMLSMPQLSVVPLSAWAAVRLPVPSLASCIVTFCTITSGAMLSSMATSNVVVPMLPAKSTAVRVTVMMASASEQSNSVMSTYSVSIAMLSVAERLSLFSTSKKTSPLASK